MNTPDLTDYRVIHRSLRVAPRRLAAALDGFAAADERHGAAVDRYWAGYAGEVLAHHTIEDDILFPALVERVPAAAEHLGRVDGDHHLLDELMAESAAAIGRLRTALSTTVAADAATTVRALADHMDAHLDFEDDALVPLFGSHFDAEEYERLGAQARRSLGLGRQAAFTVPFVVHWADPADASHLMGKAPLPFRALHRLTRGGHARLAARALGPGADRLEARR